MRIPPKLLIRGKKWTVVIRENLQCELGVVCDGLMDSTDRVIYLDDQLRGKNAQIVFWHEFGHAVLAEYGFGVVGIPTAVEEMIVNIFAIELVESFKITHKK